MYPSCIRLVDDPDISEVVIAILRLRDSEARKASRPFPAPTRLRALRPAWTIPSLWNFC